MGKEELKAKYRQRIDTSNAPPFEEQFKELTDSEKKAFETLKEQWKKEEKEHGVVFSDIALLNRLRASPGKGPKFNVETSLPALRKCAKLFTDLDFANITSESEAVQGKFSSILSIPGCRDVDGNPIFYSRSYKFFPDDKETPLMLTATIYGLTALTEDPRNAKEGISFMANMENFGWKNFSKNSTKMFLNAMQGAVSCRIRRFFIVNPMRMFSLMWTMTRPLMSKEFANKFVIIKGKELKNYIHPDDLDLLPDDFGGELTLADRFEIFQDVRKNIESKKK